MSHDHQEKLGREDVSLLRRLHARPLSWSEASSLYGHLVDRLEDMGMIRREQIPDSRIGATRCVLTDRGKFYGGALS